MIVWLKTGGPAMTVKNFDSFHRVWRCTWFLNKKVEEYGFSTEQLTTEDPNPPIMVV